MTFLSVRAPARVVLVGAGGYGQVHAANIKRLEELGIVTLVAVVDPAYRTQPPNASGHHQYPDMEKAFAVVADVDVVVIAAPINAHAQLAETALRYGADVLLEKPPVSSLADFNHLIETERQTGRVIQVGFQSLGSHGPAQFRTDGFGIGRVVRVSAVGAWSRSLGYWSRSPWAGRRSMDGEPVIDGVVTNPLAHAVATALDIVGCRALEDVESVETDLYRANDIDSDDTSVVRIRTAAGAEVTCAFTLCASAEHEAQLHVEGARGRAVFAYTADRVDIWAGQLTQSLTVGRDDLLENLVAHRVDRTSLLVPLASTGAFMRVLDAVALAEEPVRIDPRAISWSGEGLERHPVVDNVEEWLARSASSGLTFAELETPWAHRQRDTVLVRARLGGTDVADYRNGAGTIPTSSPRPFLHPVRTLAGVVVSARHPADHDWHAGVGMAIPRVNGNNFWGGPTYRRERGYELLEDHGVITGEPPTVLPGGFAQQLHWIGADGTEQLSEKRAVHWAVQDAHTWTLHFDTRLTAHAATELGSPGSHGRSGGGYGGFFWRLPPCRDVEVFTEHNRGEAEVHGRVAPWLAWSADFLAGSGTVGPATLIVASADAATAGEPWFVRAHEYPGFGSALAWDSCRTIGPGEVLPRRFDIAVADGRLAPDDVFRLAARLSAPVPRSSDSGEPELRPRNGDVRRRGTPTQ